MVMVADMSDRWYPTTARLAAEWLRLTHCPVALGRAHRWALLPDPPTRLDDIVDAVGGGGNDSHEADLLLRRLVAIAADDELAARIVIERLRRGLLAIAGRRREPRAFEDLLAAAWIAVRTYDQNRRNRFVAAALLADAEWQAFRRQERRKWNDDLPLIDGDRWAAPTPMGGAIEPEAELAALLADARQAGVDTADLDLVDLLLRIPSVDDVAAQLEVTPRTVRNRRTRVAARLREIALAA